MIDLEVSIQPHPLECLRTASFSQLLEKLWQYEWAFRRRMSLSTTQSTAVKLCCSCCYERFFNDAKVLSTKVTALPITTISCIMVTHTLQMEWGGGIVMGPLPQGRAQMVSLAVTWIPSSNLWCTNSQRSGQVYYTV